MTGSRPGRIWGLIAEQAASRAGRVSAGDACTAAVVGIGVTGAWLTAGIGSGADYLIDVTDDVSERLAELRLTLGEGPCQDASVSGGPVLASDLGEAEYARRWPAFAPAACLAGAAAMFAFPLRVGAIRAGVMGMYRDRRGPLSAFQLDDALVLADAATLLLLDLQGEARETTEYGSDGQLADLTSHRAEIDQATGMLAEQLGIDIVAAFVQLRAYAYAHDRRLSDLASDIVTRRLRLSAGPDPSADGSA
jgi:ANTAR domain